MNMDEVIFLLAKMFHLDSFADDYHESRLMQNEIIASK
jgi:hypothetical protein